jgi:sec-independent protein translocase protein TatA
MDFPGPGAQNGAFARQWTGARYGETMGLAMSVPQLLIILVIVALIFGTKRLKEVGGDLGSAVKSFRKAMNHAEDQEDEPPKRITQEEEQKK